MHLEIKESEHKEAINECNFHKLAEWYRKTWWVGVAVKLWACVWEVLLLNLGWDRDCLTNVIHGFPQALQANAWEVRLYQIMCNSLFITCSTIRHYIA